MQQVGGFGGGGATTLDGLTDVAITSPTSGQLLRYNGTNFVNATVATGDFTWLTKTVTESVASSTTLQDDDTFQFTMDANGIYWVELIGRAVVPTANNLKGAFIVPSYPSGISQHGINLSVNTGQTIIYVATSAPTASTINIGTSLAPTTFCARGIVACGSTGGTFKFQWAQVTSDAGNTQILVGSTLAYKKLN